MKDRVPLYPGRVKLTPVAGQENVYDMVRADQPTQEGTPLNKNSLLKDATAALFQLSGDTALPDKVFEILSKAALVGEDGELVTPGGVNPKTVKVIAGSYVGTGTSSKSLSFSGELFLLIVTGMIGNNASYRAETGTLIIDPNHGSYFTSLGGSVQAGGSVSMSGSTTVTWNGTTGGGDLQYPTGNVSGQTYHYKAFILGV